MEPSLEKEIAIVMDADGTSIVEMMQNPLLDHFNHDRKMFWKEVDRYAALRNTQLHDESGFPEHLRIRDEVLRTGTSDELLWATVVLNHVKYECPVTGQKRWKGLSRTLLRELGKDVELFPGMPDVIVEEKERVLANPEWRTKNVVLKWYMLSGGDVNLIAGSPIGQYLDGIFAYELMPTIGDDPFTGEVHEVVFPMTAQGKPEFIYRIHKRTPHVNDFLPDDERPVRGECIMYVADGQNDIQTWVNVNHLNGSSVCVWNPDLRDGSRARKFMKDRRVQNIAEADYSPGSDLRDIIVEHIDRSAEQLMQED